MSYHQPGVGEETERDAHVSGEKKELARALSAFSTRRREYVVSPRLYFDMCLADSAAGFRGCDLGLADAAWHGAGVLCKGERGSGGLVRLSRRACLQIYAQNIATCLAQRWAAKGTRRERVMGGKRRRADNCRGFVTGKGGDRGRGINYDIGSNLSGD